MHGPIASNHIVPEHIWSIHAEHDLWPLGRTRQGVGTGRHTGEVQGRQQGVSGKGAPRMELKVLGRQV